MKAALAAVVAVHVATLAVLLHHTGDHHNVLLLAITSVTFLISVAVVSRARLSRKSAAWLVLGVAAVLQLIALTRAPLTSDDANRYVWDGTVQFAGIDPYRYAPQDPALHDLRTTYLFGPESDCTHRIPGSCTTINRPAAHTIYPPVAQFAFDAGHVLSFGGHGGVRVFQVFGALGALAVAALLMRHALARGRPLWPVALWAWCPVVVSEFGNNAHLDWLGVVFTVLALRAGASGRDTRAGILAGLAIATKLYPALALPALMRRRPWWVAGVAAATVVVVYLPHLVVAAPDVLGYLPGYLSEEGYDSGARFVLLGLVLPSSAATVAAVVLLLAAAWWSWRRSDPAAPEHSATLLTGIAFAVATPGYGWYGTLLIALAVQSARYEWIAIAAAPSFVYLVRADTHSDTYSPWIYLAAAAVTAAVWWFRTHRWDDHADGRTRLPGLPLTGERTVPGIVEENYWFRRHEAAYLWAVPQVAGRDVLEVGCGEGYGTAVLGEHARRIVGLDYDALTVAHAASAYPSAAFVRGNLAALPVRTASVDAVVTLQVIEHVWDHPQFVRECRRVLRPDGLLLVTTPNRLTFSPGLDAPVNPFHTKEFTADELCALVAANGFTPTGVYGVHAGRRWVAGGHESFVAAQLATPPDAWSDELRREVASVVATDFPVVPAEEFDIGEALDLVVLARPA